MIKQLRNLFSGLFLAFIFSCNPDFTGLFNDLFPDGFM